MTYFYPFLYTGIMLSVNILTFLFVLKIVFIDKPTTSKKILLTLTLIGFLYSWCTFFWMLNGYPLTDFGIGGFAGILLITLITGVTAFTAGLSFLCFYGLYYLRHNTTISKKKLYILFLLLFSLLGYIRSLLLWIIYYSPKTSFGFYWLFSSPSLSFAITPLKVLYRYLGVAGFDTIFGLIILIIFLYLQTSKKICFCVVFIFILCITFTSQGYSNPEKASLSVKLSDYRKVLTISTTASEKPLQQKEALTQIQIIPDISIYTAVLLPEDIGISQEIINYTHGKTSIIYGKTILDSENVLRNTIIQRNKSGDEKIISDKKFILPFGEYMPSLFYFIGVTLLGNKDIKRVANIRRYTSGEGIAQTNIEGNTVLVGLCSDLWSYEGIQKSSKNKGRDLFILESNSIFHSNPWFLINLYAWHNVHAFASRTRIITSPHNSPLWVIDGR